MAATPENRPVFEYPGKELELFQLAKNWKRYLASRLRRYVNGHVLEVGAGHGANVPFFYRDDLVRYVSLEPDSRLCEVYRENQENGSIPRRCELIQGDLSAIPSQQDYDCILYIDVLEHIEDDRAEFQRAFQRLRSGGHLAILCPAHNFLYSPFDKAIGHYRRYDKKMYRELSDTAPIQLEYLDGVGMLASLLNKSLLKQSYPSEKQIRLWDGLFVRMSRVFDPVTFRLMGKSILGVWKR